MAKKEPKSKVAEFKINVGPPILTRYERSRVVGARALQISMGAPILIEYEGKVNPIEVAEQELKEDILPIFIRREDPSGESQSIPIKLLVK